MTEVTPEMLRHLEADFCNNFHPRKQLKWIITCIMNQTQQNRFIYKVNGEIDNWREEDHPWKLKIIWRPLTLARIRLDSYD